MYICNLKNNENKHNNPCNMTINHLSFYISYGNGEINGINCRLARSWQQHK